MKVRFSEVEVAYSARGNPTYRVEIWHDGLKKHRLIRGAELEVVERKAQLQAEDWQSKWEGVKAKEVAQKAQADKKQYQENQKALANERTIEARANLEILEQTLEHTLSIDDNVDWEQLKDTSPFAEPQPEEPRAPRNPSAPTHPKKPSRNEPKFKANIGFLDHLIASRRQSKEARASSLYKKARDEWLQETSRLKEQHLKALENHIRKLEKLHSDSERNLAAWGKRWDAFVETQRESHAAIDRQRERYKAREPKAIEEYCDLVLSQSTYPDWLPKEFELSYIPENSTLLVSYSLPSVDAIPRLREVTYIQIRDEFNEKRAF